MNPDRWRRIEALFDLVADLAPAEQQARLQQECGEDAALIEEVCRLLTHDRSRGERIAEVIEGIARIPPPGEISFAGRRLVRIA